MSDAHVTITLGSSGQVVKKPRGVGGGARTDSQTFSGSKRSFENTFESKADYGSLLFSNKRLRGDDNSRSAGRNRQGGARIGREDLRLKLMRKRMSQPQRTIESREKTSRAIHSSEQSQRSSVSSILLPRRSTKGSQQMDSLRRYFSSRTSDGLAPKYPDTNVKSSEIPAAKYINEMPKVPSARQIEASGTLRMVQGDVDPSRSRGAVPMPTRPTLIAHKTVKEVPTSVSLLRSSQPDASPPTVSSFLHSLGLGKYVINFQAEEVDMIAIKQMGNRDLKELGLPMGPRKKILLALLPLSRRPTM